MEDRELANLVVSLGVGEPWGDNFPDRYRLGITDMHSVDAYAFVRDWRVAGSLMERLSGGLMYWRMDYTEDDIEGGELVQIPAGHVWVVEPERTKDSRQDESLPRAITEACCAALSDSDDQESSPD